MANTLRIDPTRTTLIRRKFVADMRRRFKALSRDIQILVVEEDAFGLKGISILQSNQIWRFRTNTQKLNAFRRWLQQQINAGILAPVGGPTGKPWLAPYIESAYKKGMLRAYTDLRRTEMALNPPSFYRGGREEFIRSAFGAPESLHKVELLYTRAFTDLQGVTAAIDTQLSRILAAGLTAGDSPLTMAREMRKSIGSLSKTRAEVIARTETIRAHAEGQLESFRRLGMEKAGIIVEWLTAGDERVRDEEFSHVAADGEKVGIDDYFQATGEALLYPGDFGGSPGNIINCRCIALYNT